MKIKKDWSYFVKVYLETILIRENLKLKGLTASPEELVNLAKISVENKIYGQLSLHFVQTDMHIL